MFPSRKLNKAIGILANMGYHNTEANAKIIRMMPMMFTEYATAKQVAYCAIAMDKAGWAGYKLGREHGAKRGPLA